MASTDLGFYRPRTPIHLACKARISKVSGFVSDTSTKLRLTMISEGDLICKGRCGADLYILCTWSYVRTNLLTKRLFLVSFFAFTEILLRTRVAGHDRKRVGVGGHK